MLLFLAEILDQNVIINDMAGSKFFVLNEVCYVKTRQCFVRTVFEVNLCRLMIFVYLL